MSQNKINILFLPKWYPNRLDPFDGNFIENYAHAIKKHCSIKVLFVHSDTSLKQPYELIDKNNKEIREVRVYFKSPQYKLSIINKIITVLRYKRAQEIGFKHLAGEQIDLCHIHVLTRSSWLALRLKKRFNIPFVISEHWSGYHKKLGGYKGFFKKWFTNKIVKESRAIHTVSTHLKKAMQAHRLIGNYTVIPNVVDTSIFKVREKNNLDTEIIYVGNLLQQPKRILDIIEIFAQIVEKYPAALLSIYGEGKDEDDCKKLIKKLHLSQNVFLRGVRNREEIAEAIGESDFLLLFSAYENQPCVINEAQSCGIPVVVPTIPGISELMSEELGITFPTNDKNAFKSSVIEMIEKHRTYNRDTIRKSAIQRFSEEEIGKNFLSLYQKALTVEPK